MFGWFKRRVVERVSSLCTHPQSLEEQKAGLNRNWPESRRIEETNAIFRTLLEVAVREFQIRWENPQLFKNTHGTDWQIESVSMSDFERVRTLGTGAFGRVLLVRRRRVSTRSAGRQEYFALKLVEKAKVVKMSNVAHTVNERRVLASVRHPFLVELLAHFKDSSYVCMLLEYIAGGELFGLLRKKSRLTEPFARFYASQLLLAFEYLHSVGVMYRDLCAENVLIDARGFVKLTDFGFAKHLRDGPTYTFCGTIEYLAPEMVNRQGHRHGVDWWAFGVLLFEMVAGFVPFNGDDHPSIIEKIGTATVDFPADFSPELRELIGGLLERDPVKRLGALKDGLVDIRGQSWFAQVDWIAVYKRELEPPYMPKLAHPGDTSYFEPYDEEPLTFAEQDLYADEFSSF